MLVVCAIVTIPLLTTHVSVRALLSWRPPLLTAIGLILVAGLFHEAGHATAAALAGRGRVQCRFQLAWVAVIPVVRLRLTGFWALARGERILVVCAGCLAQVVLAAASIDAWVTWLAMTGTASGVFLWFAAANALLALVNVLPLYPLDGYWLLALVLDRPWLRRESRGYRVVSSIGLAGLTVMAAGGLIVRLVDGGP